MIAGIDARREALVLLSTFAARKRSTLADMALLPASCQGKPLRDSYRRFEEYGGEWTLCAEQMIELILLIERACADVSVWGLLSHHCLKLLAADDYLSPWYVIVCPMSDRGYAIRYRTPSGDASDVERHAPSSAAAAEMVHKGMMESGGWPDLR